MPTDEIIEAQKRWFVGKKLESIVWNDPYVRYVFEGGGHFEQYQHLGELNWIPVENGHPSNVPVGPDTDQVLIKTDRVYYPSIGTATGEWTEDGFIWHPDNPKVLDPEFCNNYKPINVTHWAAISLPIEHKGVKGK